MKLKITKLSKNNKRREEKRTTAAAQHHYHKLRQQAARCQSHQSSCVEQQEVVKRSRRPGASSSWNPSRLAIISQHWAGFHVYFFCAVSSALSEQLSFAIVTLYSSHGHWYTERERDTLTVTAISALLVLIECINKQQDTEETGRTSKQGNRERSEQLNKITCEEVNKWRRNICSLTIHWMFKGQTKYWTYTWWVFVVLSSWVLIKGLPLLYFKHPKQCVLSYNHIIVESCLRYWRR